MGGFWGWEWVDVALQPPPPPLCPVASKGGMGIFHCLNVGCGRNRAGSQQPPIQTPRGLQSLPSPPPHQTIPPPHPRRMVCSRAALDPLRHLLAGGQQLILHPPAVLLRGQPPLFYPGPGWDGNGRPSHPPPPRADGGGRVRRAEGPFSLLLSIPVPVVCAGGSCCQRFTRLTTEWRGRRPCLVTSGWEAHRRAPAGSGTGQPIGCAAQRGGGAFRMRGAQRGQNTRT